MACFETIEHVPEPDGVLVELRRVLADDGLLLVSTPNKHEYLVENEFHEREFFHEEFVALLEAHFERVEILLQHNWLMSAVLGSKLARGASGDEALEIELRKVAGIEPGGELYTLALCGSGDLPRLRPGRGGCRGRRGTSAGGALGRSRAHGRALAQRVPDSR